MGNSGLAARSRLNYTAGVDHGVDPALPQERARKSGAIAQLGERFNGIEEVVGSIPSGSTNSLLNMNGVRRVADRWSQRGGRVMPDFN